MPDLTLGNLRAKGAIIEVAVGPSAPRARALERARRPPVLPVFVRALVDTGAASTCVDFSLIEELGLLPKGDSSITSPTTRGQAAIVPVFDIQLQLIGPPHATASPALPVLGMDLSGLRVRVLLGRDVLGRCLLVYNGPSDQFTFSF
jgi:hypothetical protein